MKRRLALASFGCAALACASPDAKPSTESAVATPARAGAPSVASAWSPELGSFFMLPVESETLAVVLLPSPDASGVMSNATRVTLLNAAGDTATASAVLDTLQCVDAPVLRLSGRILPGWGIGMHGQQAQIIRMDSVEALTASDSARVTSALARLGSLLTANVQPEFKGLPFTVARARRFQVDTTVVVAAHLIRRVPQEAAPIEEHTFILAERPLANPDSFRVVYSQQSEGTEENAEHFEVLAALRSAEGVTIILARDRQSHSTYQLLRRSASGEWTLTWSRELRC